VGVISNLRLERYLIESTHDHLATGGLLQIAWKSLRCDSSRSRNSSRVVFTTGGGRRSSLITLYVFCSVREENIDI
jgi:hypothetical protein